MVNIFDFAKTTALFKKYKVSQLLFTEYKCLEKEPVFQIYADCNYFVYVLSGKKKWQTPFGEYIVHQGEALFVKKSASIIHKFFDVDFCALIIFIPDDFIIDLLLNNKEDLCKNKEEYGDTVIPVSLDDTLNAYFQSLFSYFLKDVSPPATLLEVKFKELILNLISSPANNMISGYFSRLVKTGRVSMREIMESNFTYNLKLDEYAKLCGRSLTSFKRDFEETFHTTPGKWLQNRRIQYGKHLLETTDKNINQLAFESGFEDASHFIKVFKHQFQVTPLQYKKQKLEAKL